MVLIQVENQTSHIPYDIIKHSKLIQDLLSYKQKSSNLNDSEEPIYLGVTKQQWSHYLDFINTGNPTVDALRVIDYLDNSQQVVRWYHQRLVMGDSLVRIRQLFKNTNFRLEELDPWFTTKDIDTIIPYVQHMSQLPTVYIQHIFLTLFNWNLYNIYRLCFDHDNINNIPNRVITALEDGKFVIQNTNSMTVSYNSGALFNLPVGTCFHDRRPEIISPRLAKQYNNINIYSQGKQLITCPKSATPYLQRSYRELPIFGSLETTNHYTICCSPTDNGIQPQQNIYDPNYTPLLNFHDTGVTISNKHLYCYNIPSTYNRNYYLYLIYEYDPIANKIYAFSL